jgi:hypothetical protein
MTPRTDICPRLARMEGDCTNCEQDFEDSHDGAEFWPHTYHYCGCTKVATLADGEDVCLGCGEARDVWAEYNARWGAA